MRDELDRAISDYFEAQETGVPLQPLPPFLQEATGGEGVRVPLRRQEDDRHPAFFTLAALPLKLAGAAAIAAICVVAAPPKTASLVARGVQVLIEDTEFRATLFSATMEITLALGKTVSKE